MTTPTCCAPAGPSAIGCVVKAPSTLGTFLRSFRWGHVRQLDRVSREFLARAWAAGGGPGDAPLTIDLDSTVCETYGLRHGSAGLSPAAGRGRGHRRRADGAAAPGSGQHRAGRGPRRWAGCLRRSHRPPSAPTSTPNGRRLPGSCAISSRTRRTWTAAPTWPRLYPKASTSQLYRPQPTLWNWRERHPPKPPPLHQNQAFATGHGRAGPNCSAHHAKHLRRLRRPTLQPDRPTAWPSRVRLSTACLVDSHSHWGRSRVALSQTSSSLQ